MKRFGLGLLGCLAWLLASSVAGVRAQAPPEAAPTGTGTGTETEVGTGTETETEAETGTEAEPELQFGATARVKPEPAGQRRVTLEETRQLPGTFGDPFRVVETLPGVAPVASGLPYFYIRGAPPATVTYAYDGIPIPLLYHFALGPSAIHPRMLGPLVFHPGSPPARFGRRLGASLAAEGPEPASEPWQGEAELRVLDANGYIRAPLGDGSLQLSGRYGYPGLLLGLIEPRTTLDYWDYQSRIDLPLGPRTQLQTVILGSFDQLKHPPWGSEEDRFNEVKLQFHRIELRLLQRDPTTEIGLAVRAGYDESSLDRELAVRALSAGPRMWIKHRFSRAVRLHLGADMQGSIGDIQSAVQNAPLQVGGRRQLRVDLPFFADAAARNAGGAFAELHLEPSSRWTLELGVRSDVWLVEGDANAAIDPRARATFNASRDVQLHVAAGLAHQPAVFLFPVPGLTEVALDRGLQESIQSEAGIAIQLPGALRLESQAFVHHYADLLLPELYAPDDGATPRRADALSYGVEVFLKRSEREALSGWLSYTLGWADAHELPNGETFSPEFDIRHVLNLVLQYRLDLGLTFGLRGHLRSGRPFNQFDFASEPTYEVRLPAFARLDARIGYDWRTSFGAMHAYLEWLNVTLAKEELGAECFFGTCQVQTAPAIYFPNAGLRAEF